MLRILTSKPINLTSRKITCQPANQPTKQPTSLPASQPVSQPANQPASQPTSHQQPAQPTQPANQPTSHQPTQQTRRRQVRRSFSYLPQVAKTGVPRRAVSTFFVHAVLFVFLHVRVTVSYGQTSKLTSFLRFRCGGVPCLRWPGTLFNIFSVVFLRQGSTLHAFHIDLHSWEATCMRPTRYSCSWGTTCMPLYGVCARWEATCMYLYVVFA
jgi:hypothetical protein